MVSLGNLGSAAYYSSLGRDTQLAQQRQQDAIAIEQQQLQSNRNKMAMEQRRMDMMGKVFSDQVDAKTQTDYESNAQKLNSAANMFRRLGDTDTADKLDLSAKRNADEGKAIQTANLQKQKDDRERKGMIAENFDPANPDTSMAFYKMLSDDGVNLADPATRTPEFLAAKQKEYINGARTVNQIETQKKEVQKVIENHQYQDKVRSEVHVQKLKSASDKAKMQDGLIDDKTLDFNADMYLEGEKSVFVGMGRSPTLLARQRQALRRRAEAKGYTPAQIVQKIAEFEGLKAAQRTAGTTGGRIAVGAAETEQFSKQALEASDKVPRTNFVPLNRLIQMGESQWSPEQAAFFAANHALVQSFANAIAKTGAKTQTDVETYKEQLNMAYSHEQYKAVVNQMMKEMEGLKKAPAEARKAISGILGGEETKPMTSLPPGFKPL